MSGSLAVLLYAGGRPTAIVAISKAIDPVVGAVWVAVGVAAFCAAIVAIYLCFRTARTAARWTLKIEDPLCRITSATDRGLERWFGLPRSDASHALRALFYLPAAGLLDLQHSASEALGVIRAANQRLGAYLNEPDPDPDTGFLSTVMFVALVLAIVAGLELRWFPEEEILTCDGSSTNCARPTQDLWIEAEVACSSGLSEPVSIVRGQVLDVSEGWITVLVGHDLVSLNASEVRDRRPAPERVVKCDE